MRSTKFKRIYDTQDPVTTCNYMALLHCASSSILLGKLVKYRLTNLYFVLEFYSLVSYCMTCWKIHYPFSVERRAKYPLNKNIYSENKGIPLNLKI